jgi:hypothetical protein
MEKGHLYYDHLGVGVNAGGDADVRGGKRDRRREPTPVFSRYTLFGRRRINRRGTDRRRGYYVDLYNARLLAVLLLIVALSLMDALCTHQIIARGGSEWNPLMRVLLDISEHAFFSYKFVMTAIGVIILCLHKNFRFVRHLISMILLFYVLLMFYQVTILYAL